MPSNARLRSNARRFSLLLGAVAATPALVLAQAKSSPAPDFAAFDRYVAKAARDWHVPGLAIAVVKDDSLVFAKGYGVIELGKPGAADAHTRFAIGSTTKAMTSALLAMLVDEGKLRWDDRVITYIPELQLYDPYATRDLTIRDLLTHRSGLGSADLMWARWHFSLAEMIRRLRYLPPAAPFRSQWQYHNIMYAMSGLIVERVSGMPWDAFLRSRIFAPLGMTESEALVSSIKGKANVAVPHVEMNDSVRVVPIRSTDDVAAAGSVYSSVTDMSKWMRFILDSGRVGNKRLITAATFREIIAPQIRAPMSEYPALQLAKPDFFSYGLGWFIQDYAGQAVWMHTGSIDGMCAIIGLMPNERVGVYVLENLDHAELRHGLMYSAFDLYNGGPQRDWSAELRTLFQPRAGGGRGGAAASHVVTAPTLPLERYVGTYVDSAYGNVQVTLDNGALQAQIVNEPIARLEPYEYDTFRTRGDATSVTAVTFVPDGAGNVSGVRVSGIVFARQRAGGRRG
jgi:CubicO group peptidase (beta-lactamase class C family)